MLLITLVLHLSIIVGMLSSFSHNHDLWKYLNTEKLFLEDYQSLSIDNFDNELKLVFGNEYISMTKDIL